VLIFQDTGEWFRFFMYLTYRLDGPSYGNMQNFVSNQSGGRMGVRRLSNFVRNSGNHQNWTNIFVKEKHFSNFFAEIQFFHYSFVLSVPCDQLPRVSSVSVGFGSEKMSAAAGWNRQRSTLG